MSKAIGQGIVTVSQGTGTRSDGSSYNEVVYEGLASSIVSAHNALVRAGYKPWGYSGNEVECTLGGGKGRLVVRAANLISPQPFVSIKLLANSVQKDIFDAVPEYFQSLTDDQLIAVADFMDGTETNPPSNFTDLQLELVDLVTLGTRQITIEQPVLVRTVEAPSGYTLNLSFVNVGSVLSTAAMSNDANLGPALRFNLPNFSSPRNGFNYGWLKKMPEVEASRRSVDLVSQAWEYGLFSDAVYTYVS